MEICKKRGIIFPAAEIYGGVAGFFEYGPIGVLMKRKLENYWLEYFVKAEENIFEINGCVILPDFIWKASGHLKSFVDPLVKCKKCKIAHRADDLVERKTGKSAESLSI